MAVIIIYLLSASPPDSQMLQMSDYLIDIEAESFQQWLFSLMCEITSSISLNAAKV